jgi:hypothetical protein
MKGKNLFILKPPYGSLLHYGRVLIEQLRNRDRAFPRQINR